MCVQQSEFTYKISVVLPIYNQEKYLDRSVSSLLNQSYINLEIILVNDGSTDRSPAIVREYEEKDPRVRVIDKTNGGLPSATVAGIRAARGEYICFLDPDDFAGADFLENFAELYRQHPGLDFYAAGYYTDCRGDHVPHPLYQNRLYDRDDISGLRNRFLYDVSHFMSEEIFISRWNKMYRTDMIQDLAGEFIQYSHISLGEDTIFTFLMLNRAESGYASDLVNSCYYNIGNQSSMMKSADLQQQLKKAAAAAEAFGHLLKKYRCGTAQAYILYYDLVSNAVNLALSEAETGRPLFSHLKNDRLYVNAMKVVSGSTVRKERIRAELFLTSGSFSQYSMALKAGGAAIKARDGLKKTEKHFRTLAGDVRKCGPGRSLKKLRFQKNRERAQEDLNSFLPTLEKRIYPIIKPYIGRTDDPSDSSVEKNVFVFWWDGFDHAPEIVRCCLDSVRNAYPDCRVIPITRYNYLEYTDIHPDILKAFDRGDISVQTFSDILRFNLLYVNGGMWTDATIYFRDRLEMVGNLKDKSFESLCFSTSEEFLRYRGYACTWSGFLIASRKHGLFAEVMNEIFRQYYLKYRTYSIYFFIDAAFMICKIHGIDGGVLERVQRTGSSMFDLVKILSCRYYSSEFTEATAVPQKLSWLRRIDSENGVYSNYNHMIDCMSGGDRK